MNTLIATDRQMNLIRRGYREAVIAWYDHSGVERGEVISLHRTEAAQQAKLRKDRSGMIGGATIDQMTVITTKYGRTLSAPENPAF